MAEANALIAKLQSVEGCSYLSDLHTNSRLLSKQAKSLERYSLQEWNEVATYAKGRKSYHPTAEEAKKSMMAGK